MSCMGTNNLSCNRAISVVPYNEHLHTVFFMQDPLKLYPKYFQEYYNNLRNS